jgi:hypothetical protein
VQPLETSDALDDLSRIIASDIDDRIIEKRLNGASIRSIATMLKVPTAQVQSTVNAWAIAMLPTDRREILALQIGRLERQLEVWTPLSLSGNAKALTGVLKILNQLNLLHGVYQPTQAIVQLEPPVHRPTSTDRIEAALNALIAQRKKPDDEATHH